jgi:hypothetical protein
MIEAHEGTVKLLNSFEFAYEWLRSEGEVDLKTSTGTSFTTQAEITKKGAHSGEPVIRFFQHGDEYARSYECCWGHYYNCNRTRIGMYCKALDLVV